MDKPSIYYSIGVSVCSRYALSFTLHHQRMKIQHGGNHWSLLIVIGLPFNNKDCDFSSLQNQTFVHSIIASIERERYDICNHML